MVYCRKIRKIAWVGANVFVSKQPQQGVPFEQNTGRQHDTTSKIAGRTVEPIDQFGGFKLFILFIHSFGWPTLLHLMEASLSACPAVKCVVLSSWSEEQDEDLISFLPGHCSAEGTDLQHQAPGDAVAASVATLHGQKWVATCQKHVICPLYMSPSIMRHGQRLYNAVSVFDFISFLALITGGPWLPSSG